MPPRPRRPLSTWQILRIYPDNAVAVCDDELFEELIVERRYAWGRVFVVSDPDAIRHIFQGNGDNYVRIKPTRRAFTFSTGGGMNHVEGEAHSRHRRTINPTLYLPALQADLPEMIRLAEQMAERLAELPSDHAFEMGRTLTHLLNRTTGHVFAGADPAVDEMLLRLGRFPENYGPLDVLPLPRSLYVVDRLRRRWTGISRYFPLIDRLIEERRDAAYAGGDDLLRRMALAQDRDTGLRLTPTELRDEVLTLATGAQAPLRTMTWAWYLLTQFPEAERRLHDELEEVLGDRPLTPDDLPRLVFLRRLVDETMRLYPPLPLVFRQALADDEIGGRRIPRRSLVIVSPWVIHHHRKLWADPDTFDPDRFAPDRDSRRSRYAYIPFGVGSHICVAASLAMAEILIAMAVLSRRVRFRLVAGQRVEPIAWSTLRPRGGMMMTAESRARP
jgi:cytochrome P450